MISYLRNQIAYVLALTFFIGLFSCGDADKRATDSENTDTTVATPMPAIDTSKSEDASVKIAILEEASPELGDLGCSCSFRTEKENYKTQILLSDFDTYAPMNLNGETVLFRGGQTDSNAKYVQYSMEKYWITMNERGDDYVFGKKIEYGTEQWEEDLKSELIHALLFMEELPKEPRDIAIKTNGTVGMGRRGAVGDVIIAALDTVRQKREELQKAYPATFHFSNDIYDCYITAQQYGTDDGGGAKYEGELVLKSKSGKVLATQKVWGGCGC